MRLETPQPYEVGERLLVNGQREDRFGFAIARLFYCTAKAALQRTCVNHLVVRQGDRYV